MTTILSKQILIQVEDLVKAMAATIRWKASYNEDYQNDDHHLTIIAQFLEDIAIENNDLLKALVAAVRWKASYTEDYQDDEKHLTVISQLMEKLLNSN